MLPTLKTTLALLGLVLAAPLAHSQQAPTPTKTTKATRRAARTAAGAPTTPPPAPQAGAGAPVPPPPAGGPGAGPGRPGAAPGPGGPGPGGPGAKGPGAPAGRVQALSDFSGTLTDYTAANDDQVYDAFSLKTSTGTETVRFPRHLAQGLMAAAKAGSAVTVTGFRSTDPEGRAALHLVSLTAGGQTVRDTPPARPTTPPTEEAATARGTVMTLTKDPRGRTTGLTLSDGTLLRLPPAATEQLAEKLKTGAAVEATGFLRAAHPGEVAARPVRVVRAQTLTLDGVKFLVQ
ncbi:MAG: OB-fold nucleic acid binding domain-containing protein [Janthinobacterium lividum]